MLAKKKHTGFTLVELVVVVMILGILAAIAVPKLLNVSRSAKDNGTKVTLSVIRDAIEVYVSLNDGQLPGQTDDLPGDLSTHLRAGFPVCNIGPVNNASIKYSSVAGAITGASSPTEAWHYNKLTGEFICNFNGPTVSDPNTNYDEL